MWLTPEQVQTLLAHVRAEAPREACGIIAGVGDRAVEVIPIANTAADPLHSYYMDERHLVETLSSLPMRRLDLFGFYHSHPQGDPIPSTTDIKQASYPDTPYLIIGIKGTEARLATWSMRFGQVSEVPLHIGTQPPSLDISAARAISSAQKIAILLSALIAFILLIVLSLSLLPPAPHIPH